MAEMSMTDETKAHGIYCFFETINSYFITYSETNNKGFKIFIQSFKSQASRYFIGILLVFQATTNLRMYDELEAHRRKFLFVRVCVCVGGGGGEGGGV